MDEILTAFEWHSRKGVLFKFPLKISLLYDDNPLYLVDNVLVFIIGVFIKIGKNL